MKNTHKPANYPIPDENRIEELLSNIQPVPGEEFLQKMQKAPWRVVQTSQRELPMKLKFAFYTLAVLLVLVGTVFSVPSVRASISAWIGLGVAPSDTVIPPVLNPTVIVETPVSPQATAEAPENPPVSSEAPHNSVIGTETLNRLSDQAGWQVVSPSSLPTGYNFDSAYHDSNNGLVFFTFLATRQLPDNDPTLTETKAITMVQSLKNDTVPLQVAPSTEVQDVLVNGQPAAYAVGAWDTSFVPDPNDPNNGHFESTWRNDLNVQNVFWQIGDTYIVLVTDDAAVTPGELIAMADSVR